MDTNGKKIGTMLTTSYFYRYNIVSSVVRCHKISTFGGPYGAKAKKRHFSRAFLEGSGLILLVLPAKPYLTLTLALPIALADPNPNPNPQPSPPSQSSRFSILPLCAKRTKATMMAMSYVRQLLLTPGTLLAFLTM